MGSTQYEVSKTFLCYIIQRASDSERERWKLLKFACTFLFVIRLHEVISIVKIKVHIDFHATTVSSCKHAQQVTMLQTVTCAPHWQGHFRNPVYYAVNGRLLLEGDIPGSLQKKESQSASFRLISMATFETVLTLVA